MHGVFKTGVEFTVSVMVYTKGKTSICDNVITVKGANKAVILLNIKTNISDYDSDVVFPDLTELDFDSLLLAHSKKWRELYDRCFIEPEIQDKSNFTDERLAVFKEGYDNTLPILYFNFGRYLTLASAGDLPPHLQGIWNERLDPPWDSDFHTDINLQMNYLMC